MNAGILLVFASGLALSACTFGGPPETDEMIKSGVQTTDLPPPSREDSTDTFQSNYATYKGEGASDKEASRHALEDAYFQTGFLPDTSVIQNH